VVAARFADVDLPPDVFAVVMATGIVSIAAQDHGFVQISGPLAVFAVAAFTLLIGALTTRLIGRTRSAFGAVRDPDVALRWFTFVAACAVLGARFDAYPVIVWALGAAAATAWLVLAPVALADVRSRPRTELRDHAHGAWLLPSVATAGLAITAADLAARSGAKVLLAAAVAAWLLGLIVYLAVTWLIVWRAVAAPFEPAEVTPDGWILMGALAIATLAGGRVLAAADALGVCGWIADSARAVTLGTWTVGSAWIPVLLYAQLWLVRRQPESLRYTGRWWSAVFPLGMYAVASADTAEQLSMSALNTISLMFFWVALAVWLLVAAGLTRRVAATCISARTP
jgi:tellurite resistance protein TehA-like permease